MLKSGIKKFYEKAVVEKNSDGDHRILLDGRTVRSPMRNELILPSSKLAAAIAVEWSEQSEQIQPESMPLTQLAFTALDRVGAERQIIVDGVVKYGETDLLCYRADHPADLVELQRKSWDPLLDWAASTFGATITKTSGIAPVSQPPQAIAALREPVENLDGFHLTALTIVVQASGSLIVGLAFVSGRLDAEQAAAASLLDDTYQNAKWGEDKEAVERLTGIRREINDAGHFMSLL